MEKTLIPFGRRIEENIKNYTPGHLFHIDQIESFFEDLNKTLGVEILLTDRYGAKMACAGDFPNQMMDVEAKPGIKIRIANRTVGHLYSKLDGVAEEQKANVAQMMEHMSVILMSYAQVSYLHNESVDYMDELEDRLEKETYQVKYHERNDIVTGTLNRTYFENRVKIVERAGVLPVGVMVANINDWMFFRDHYGADEGDRLVKMVAQILKKEAKKDYVIGRVDGDEFHVMVPMVEDGELDSYMERIKKACLAVEDSVLVPSVALGSAVKRSEEERIEDLFSDAEYEMVEDKILMKQETGYQEKMEKGLGVMA